MVLQGSPGRPGIPGSDGVPGPSGTILMLPVSLTAFRAGHIALLSSQALACELAPFSKFTSLHHQ